MEGQKKMVCTFAIGRQKILNYLSDVLASNTYINGGHFRPPSCFITRSKMSGFKLTFCASMRILVMEALSDSTTGSRSPERAEVPSDVDVPFVLLPRASGLAVSDVKVLVALSAFTPRVDAVHLH